MILGRLRPRDWWTEWWPCLRCQRFFSKKVSDLICFDCIKETK